MKFRILAFGTILAMFIVGTATSEVKVQRFYTGGVMLSHCVSESAYRAVCMGYLLGIYDAHGVHVGSGMPKYFCAPKKTDPERLREIFVKYVSEDPRRVELASASLALNAFRGAFPCE